MTLTYRRVKGVQLTPDEADGNMDHLLLSANHTFVQPGSGAVSETIQTVLRYAFKSVKSYGAVGDGSTDDTAAIQACIDACNTAGGGIVYFPPGTYKITASINLPAYTSIRITGAGPNVSSILVSANSVKAFNITGLAARVGIEDLWIGSTIARTGCYGIYVAGTSSAVPASEIYIRHVNIQNLNTGLYWSQVQLSKIDWLRILNSVNSSITGNGMYFFGVVSSRIRDVQITTTNGKIGGEYVLVDGDCDSVVLDGVEGYGGTTNVGFRFQLGAGTTGPRLTKAINCYSETADSDGFYVSDGRDVRFIGCHAAANSANGFEVVGGSSIVMESCFALQNYQYGFIASGGDGGILGCTASNNSQQTDNTYGGIRIAADTTHWRVIGNRSGDYVLSLANGQAYGLTLGAGASDYIVAKDNDLQGNKTGPILNSSTGANNDLDYESTFTATGTGFTATVNGTGRFRREGRHATVYLPTSLTGTSNTTAFTITGMPTDIRPARNQSFPVLITDNGVNAFGWAVVATTGTITLAPTAANNAAGWTNAGTKAIAEQVLTYSLD